ncbi:DBF4-type zinc finger-containing protein 2 isoform X2 [Amia ocellicauda]|uniref:DBF4-type zinc finger-containing protein 2 isoform X2 n=1 Tax=Amia ocellicauda TaxID=2972642 RepID=UPI003464AB13
MYDKIMPVEEQSAPSAQEIDRTHTEVLTKADRISGNSVIVEQPVPGPSTQQTRQGFCSCCQVLYNSVEQHILSSRHREFVSSSRNNVACGSLMERFLQDVIQHHPYRYNDTSSPSRSEENVLFGETEGTEPFHPGTEETTWGLDPSL